MVPVNEAHLKEQGKEDVSTYAQTHTCCLGTAPKLRAQVAFWDSRRTNRMQINGSPKEKKRNDYINIISLS